MNRFIFLSFLFMGWAFYELSGGADFVPESARKAAAIEPAAQSMPEDVKVRSGTSTNVAGPASAAAAPVRQPVVPAPEPADDRAVADLPDKAPTQPPPPPDIVLSIAALEQTPDALSPAIVKDIRSIRGSLANIRTGPGTSYDVLTQLAGGTRIEVLEDPGDGWVRMRNMDDTTMGWISASLLSQ